MKRLFLLAAMVAVLASCEKHEIQNELIQEIGFTQKLGKQTKAIAQDGNYYEDQPFGVFSYAYQELAAGTLTHKNKVMNNVEIAKGQYWTAAEKYYWPNDSRTTLNFYAYSPFTTNNEDRPNHQKIANGTISHTYAEATGESGALILTDYIHTNMYVDFMVGTPVIGSSYTKPDGVNTVTEETNKGIVPIQFNHQLSQLNFVVSCGAYPDITFTIEKIELKSIGNKSTYTGSFTNKANNAFAAGSWSEPSATTSYVVFPAKKYVSKTVNADGAPVIKNTATDNVENEFIVKYTAATNEATESYTKLETTPITVIPQTLIAKGTANESPQYLTITYRVAGDNVASETVVRDVYFKDAAAYNTLTSWGVNQKITYTLNIGLNEIKFSPSIVAWDPVVGGETTVQQ